jgi:tetratricopeptide (TPR) repeat protein
MFSWGFLIVLNLPFAIGFSNVKIYLAERHRALELQQQKDREEAELKEHIRKDSLSISIQRVKDFEENGMIDEALLELNRVDKLTTTYDEISIAQEQRINISLVKVNTLMNGRHYSQAIDLLNNLNALDTSNTETLYQRAICYSKTNHIEEAVRDARLAMIKGNESAGELYEKLNPIRKRVSYYTTLCRDGSYSDATGRGACSHHGGVASWNHPVYEEYRKFE